MNKWILVEWKNDGGRIIVESKDLLNVYGSFGVGSAVEVMHSHELRSATVVAASDDLDELERTLMPKFFPIAAPLGVWEKHEKRTTPLRFSPSNYACSVGSDDEDEVEENYGEVSQIYGIVKTNNASIQPKPSDEIDITPHQPVQYNSVDSEPMELDAGVINVNQTEKNNLKTDLLKIKNKMTEEKKYLEEMKEGQQRSTSTTKKNRKIAKFHTRVSPRSVWEKLAKNTIAKRPPAGFSASDDSSDDNNCNDEDSDDEYELNEKVKAGQIREHVKSKNTSKTSQLSDKAYSSTAHLSVQTDNVENDIEPMELVAPVLKMKLLKINLEKIRNGMAEAKELLDEIKKDKKRITGTDPTINPKTPHNRTEPANIPEKNKPLNMDPLVKFIQKLSQSNEHEHENINISKTSTCTFTSKTISESESVTISPMESNSTGQSLSPFSSAVNPNMLRASSRLSLIHPIASTSKIDQIESRLRIRTKSASTNASSFTVIDESDRYSDNVLITNKYDRVNNDRSSSTTIESEYSDNVLISNKYDTVNKRHSSTSSFSSDMNVVSIGTGCTTISKEDFDRIDWQNCGTATRSLLTCLFSRRILATHTLSGKQSPAFPDRRPKRPLDSRIVMDIIAEVMSRYRVKENYVRNIIRNKCSDENKALRKERERTSRDSGAETGGVTICPSQLPNQKEEEGVDSDQRGNNLLGVL